MVEPIDIRTGKPFASRRPHLHHPAPPSECASLGGGWGRARGLMGGAFMGCMMAAQSEPSIWRYDGKMHFWYSLTEDNFNGGLVSFKFRSVSGTATVNWGDGSTSTMSGTTISHTYADIGDYEVVVDGFATVQLDDYSWGNGNSQIVRIELGSPFTMVSGNWYHFRNLTALTRVNLNGYNLFVPNRCFSGNVLLEAVDDAEFTSIGRESFYGCTALTSVGDLTACTSIALYAFSGCTSLTRLYAPNVNSIYYSITNCTHCRSVTLGNIDWVVSGKPNWYGIFQNIGSELEPDEYGYKSTVTLGCTMAYIRAPTGYTQSGGFPWEAPKQTKFVCSDGYIVYENGRWTDHPNA